MSYDLVYKYLDLLFKNQKMTNTKYCNNILKVQCNKKCCLGFTVSA